MGNGMAKIGHCFSCAGEEILPRRRRSRQDIDIQISSPYDEAMGHSFIYLKPESMVDESTSNPTSLFRSISGASVSANASTPLSTSLSNSTTITTVSSTFQSSTSFSFIPLQLRNSTFSGPIEHTFMSGPIEPTFMSGPLEKRPRSIIRAISRKLSLGQSSIVAPIKGDSWIVGGKDRVSNEEGIQWAHGKAGEDRVHVVVSEEHGWVFVGIYDGFNGPDATDFLLSNLYSFVQEELKGLLSDEKSESVSVTCSSEIDKASCSEVKKNSKSRWKYVWDRERIELDRKLKELVKKINHSEVLNALSCALSKTEEAYFDVADEMLVNNPELSLMGSCVLLMLMKEEDVYVMNVGDSRAVLGRKTPPDLGLGKIDQDLERISEESCYDLEMFDGVRPSLSAFQLSFDHSTAIDEEVERIRREHPDDSSAIVHDRVKGSLKVTRAFGAGYLKQPKWNDALLEMFRIDYIGNSSYMNCLPSLHHHRLGSNDRFLILSSDGLYQYFTNEEAVSEVELFTSLHPDGDPAQHLVEEVLFRAAKKAGMDFYELLEIPQGERRRYHDDVSIIIISFEGTIWRSCV